MPLTLVRPAVPEPARVLLADRAVVSTVRKGRPPRDIVDEWGMQSFPASDPPANW